MRRCWACEWLGCALIVASATLAGLGQDEGRSPSPGFSPKSQSKEEKAESHALTVPTPENARSLLRTLTEEPHVAGTPADYKTAVFVRDKLREWGWQAEISEYEVLLNYPEALGRGQGGKSQSLLAMVAPTTKLLPNIEDQLASDKDSASLDAFGAFHGYGISGNVTGQVIYANYARPEDFVTLEKLGIEVKDKIVLARYGEIFRGLKVRNAQKRGARGILIYSDPADDGYAKGDTYPAGPFRPGSALQRGSVQFLSLGPGDPSTPHGPSIKGAKRLPIDHNNGFTIDYGPANFREGGMSVEEWEKATGFVREDYYAMIPALPISYDAAKPILEALSGPNVPTGWQGGLPFAYHVGPGPAEVHFATKMDYKVRTIWNVIATIKGEVEPDRWVMVGNHRDAWVYGAVDPSSGTASTLEACRALGAAVKDGWKPRRSLVYTSWDAEEYGLVGSTEWCEEHAKEIDEKAVMLLNVDVAVSGNDLDVDGVPSLRDFFLDALGAITDVRSGRSLRQTWVDKRRSQWASQATLGLPDPLWGEVADKEGRAPARFSPQMDPLGSGSDYTAFLDHLGVPSLDAGFSGRYGVYHSIYDDFTWMERVCDPEFLTHTMAARLYTVIAMRAAAADVVPMTFVPYAEVLRDEVDDLRRIVERKARAADPAQGKTPFEFKGLPRLVDAIKAFRERAEALDRATKALAGRDGIDDAKLARVNDALTRIERAFLLPAGLPGRPWFKHSVYAPGVTTGYASWPLPGVRQAILETNPDMLSAQLPALVDRINAATEAMDTAIDAAR